MMLGLLIMLIFLVSAAVYVAAFLPTAVATVTACIAAATPCSSSVHADSVLTDSLAGDSARRGRTEDEDDADGRALPTTWFVPTRPDFRRRGSWLCRASIS